MEEPGRLQSMGLQSPTWLSDFQFHNESKEDQIDSTHVYWTEIRKLQEHYNLHN